MNRASKDCISRVTSEYVKHSKLAQSWTFSPASLLLCSSISAWEVAYVVALSGAEIETDTGKHTFLPSADVKPE